jgi:hypothetical protein
MPFGLRDWLLTPVGPLTEARRNRLLVRSGPAIAHRPRPLPVALADSKHPLDRAAYRTPRTGDITYPPKICVSRETCLAANQAAARYLAG